MMVPLLAPAATTRPMIDLHVRLGTVCVAPSVVKATSLDSPGAVSYLMQWSPELPLSALAPSSGPDNDGGYTGNRTHASVLDRDVCNTSTSYSHWRDMSESNRLDSALQADALTVLPRSHVVSGTT